MVLPEWDDTPLFSQTSILVDDGSFPVTESVPIVVDVVVVEIGVLDGLWTYLLVGGELFIC